MVELSSQSCQLTVNSGQWPVVSGTEMKPFWKIVTAVLCVAVICGAAITWLVHERKLKEAASVCRASAEQGDAKAQYRLGSLYYDGQGVPKDYAEALRWYRKSADQGDAGGQNGLGFLYFHGQGVPQDDAEAVSWWQKAADQGYAKAQYSLGNMYYHGYGITHDNTKAALWYRKAAEQGYALAESGIGFMEYYGYGVPKDRADSDRWFHKAAEQGDEYAQRALGQKMSTFNKINYSVMFICFLLLLKSSGLPKWPLSDRRQRTEALSGLLGMAFVALSLFGFYHFGNCGTGLEFYIYSFVRFLLLGITVVIFISLVCTERSKPRTAKIALVIFGILFICLNSLLLFAIFHSKYPVPVRAFCSFNGMFIGNSIPLAIFLWHRHQNHESDQTGMSEVEVSESPAEGGEESNESSQNDLL
jgi:Sel1 repeat